MKANRFTVLINALLFLFIKCPGQNSQPRSLLPGNIIDEIIGEASGERAMNHIYALAAYNHDRSATEYSDLFLETRFIYEKLKEYGLEGAVINKYPGGKSWDGIRGELWEISPGRSKIADYGDLTPMLARGSTNTDVTGELVWIGEGMKDDIDRVDVENKIVVTSGSISLAHSLSVPKGALGVISYESPRPLAVPLAIPFHNSRFTLSGNPGENTATARFGFFLPPREGIVLRDRLLSGEKITVHAVVETQDLDYDLEVTSCIIKGTDPAAGEIIFTAHLFEYLVMMGANDNMSGCASILEIARMLNSMINEGRIERPKRTIRFIWVKETSGTASWVRDNKEIINNTLCNINLDMVGLWLSKYQSILYMHRTTFGNPHYINDVMENYYNFVGFGNRVSLGNGGNIKRIIAPSGSDDPFYYAIDDHAGGSDHEVFNDWGVQVPGIMMITWPDPNYHTSGDNADKCDPTQLKRVCVIGAAAAYTIAWANEAMALKIAFEVAGNALGRLGKQVIRAMHELDKARRGEFESIFKKTKGFIEATLINEKATLASTAELVGNSASFNAYLARQTASVEAVGKAALAEFENYADGKAKEYGLSGIQLKPAELELKARTIIPITTSLVTESSYRGYSGILEKLDSKVKEKYPVKGRITDITELGRLCNGKNSALDIKKLLDAQMLKGENDLQTVINHIYILRVAGLVTF